MHANVWYTKFSKLEFLKTQKSHFIKQVKHHPFIQHSKHLGTLLWDKGHLTTFEGTCIFEVGLPCLWDKGHLTTYMYKLTRVCKLDDLIWKP
ncbi:hypothetical protein HanIR_Chr13g0623681 [Helianthus annuus]|nr:hypothetical protein HanIR_Chr13g0623681 [Helianthus annuus]